MSDTMVLDPLTEFLNGYGSVDSRAGNLGYNTLDVQEDEHPLLTSLLGDWASAEKRWDSLVTPLSGLKVDGGYLHTASTQFPIDRKASRELGVVLDIPTKYLERIEATELFADNVNYWLAQGGSAEVAVVFDKKVGTINEVVPKGVFDRRLPRRGVVETLATVIGDDQARVRSVLDGLHQTVIKISSPKETVSPVRRVGDITEAGLMLVLPKSMQAPVVSAYLHRLVCTNGMTATDGRYKVEIKGLDAQEILGSIAEVGTMVWGQAKKMLHGLTVLDQEKVERPMYMIRVLAQEMRLPNRVVEYAERVVAEFTDANPSYAFTRYDLVQLLTSLAHDMRVKQAARDKIAAGAGHMVSVAADEHRCDNCHQLVP